ncbi:MAG: hypothetical protein F4W90_00500 [Gammaproteobacteria bacterium]|nr:hypothetical protein [Gammaproteobacteria bacterium]
MSRTHYLLLDDRIIESVENARLNLGKATKHEANPLFSEDQPWEMRFDNLYANVIYDHEEELFKCWYSPFIVDYSAKDMGLDERRSTPYRAPSNREMGLCYATSQDGLTWEKPALNLVEYAGSSTNNILWRGSGNTRASKAGPHGAGIMKDLSEPNPRRRYKAILKSGVLSVAFSPDGIHWDAARQCPEADSAGDTHNNAFWAPTLGKYVGITRQWSEDFQRQIARTSSEDFLNWQKVEIVLEGTTHRHQTYAMPAFYYGGIYLGLLSVHDQDTDRVQLELTWSPDAVTWKRVCPGTPLIPNGVAEGDYDWGCIYAAAVPIIRENEILIYYGGSDGLHTSWRTGYFCLATLGADRFVGYESIDKLGVATITTAEMFDATSTLALTADIYKGGNLVAEIIDEKQNVLYRSQLFSQSVTNEKVNWSNVAAASNTYEETYRLRFKFKQGCIYTIKKGAS